MSTPIYYIKDGHLSFGDNVIFENNEFYLYPQDKICLIGRNGSGKTSLLKIISREYELTEGQTYIAPNIKVSYLDQSHKINLNQSLYEFILDGKHQKHEADVFITQFNLNPEQKLTELSGGQIRRASLARALIGNPDLLLLDEPTNHLDILLIEWLENYIKNYKGTVICISHDRRFLSNVTNKVWWIDRSIMRKSDKGFKYFEKWQEEIIEEETKMLEKLNKKLTMENEWLKYGVTARRKRNQKRLTSLRSLREKLKQQQQKINSSKYKINAELQEAKKTKFIIEADKISFKYNDKVIISDFSIRIKKGEKIGIIGPNGTGKTTLLKLLIKELQPSSGIVKHGVDLDITYLDQYRASLDPEKTIQEFLCPTGGQYVELSDKTLHVAAYIKQFMFDPSILQSKISILSGGQANRLFLAKSLIKPGNFLILDEPTNDLDMDTIEILLDILYEYSGTAIIVSHDRDFLDRLTTKTLILDGKNIHSIIGDYDDYIKTLRAAASKPEQRAEQRTEQKAEQVKSQQNKQPSNAIKPPIPDVKNKNPTKLSYKHKRELEMLPNEIDLLENKILKIEKELESPTLYIEDIEKFNKLTSKLSECKNELEIKLNKWIELENLEN